MPLGGRIDGMTLGLISCTLDVMIGFPVIEGLFDSVVDSCPGAEWQFANVYHPATGELLNWWK